MVLSGKKSRHVVALVWEWDYENSEKTAPALSRHTKNSEKRSVLLTFSLGRKRNNDACQLFLSVSRGYGYP
jgi:hypothetical protein